MAIVFPKSFGFDEGGQGSTSGRPFVWMVAFDVGGVIKEQFALPLPRSVTFGDGANYSTVDLGFMGGSMEGKSLSEIGNTFKAGVAAAKNELNKARGIKAEQVKQFANDVGGMAVAIGASMIPGTGGGDLEKVISYNTKKIMNPNTRTTFESMNIRSYSFDFTLVGRTEGDSQVIREMHSKFREFMYPETVIGGGNTSVVMSFPCLWDISFSDGSGGGFNQYLPTPHDAYLTALNTSFNPSAAMFRSDGSPVETQLTLSFQESRTLTRGDIQRLNPR